MQQNVVERLGIKAFNTFHIPLSFEKGLHPPACHQNKRGTVILFDNPVAPLIPHNIQSWG